jgi:hypothetical protein
MHYKPYFAIAKLPPLCGAADHSELDFPEGGG